MVDVVSEPALGARVEEPDHWLDEVMARIDLSDADTVAIAGSPALGQEVIKRLAWRLDVFLRTWQRAIEAERKRLARECELLPFGDTAASFAVWIKNGGKP